MATVLFDRDSLAKWYAEQHLLTDPGINAIFYLPTGAPEREIRLVEVNHLMAERTDESLVPIDFGVNIGIENAHSLVIVDVTPEQWERIQAGKLQLPGQWSISKAKRFSAA